MKNRTLKPPVHLSKDAKRLWKTTVAHYDVDEPAAEVLRAGLEALDRRDQARMAIAKEGAVVKDRFGQDKPSPWVAIERDAAGTFYKAFRLLGFDLPAGSPGGSGL